MSSESSRFAFTSSARSRSRQACGLSRGCFSGKINASLKRHAGSSRDEREGPRTDWILEKRERLVLDLVSFRWDRSYSKSRGITCLEGKAKIGLTPPLAFSTIAALVAAI
jgi:hypothetical protein